MSVKFWSSVVTYNAEIMLKSLSNYPCWSALQFYMTNLKTSEICVGNFFCLHTKLLIALISYWNN